MDMLLKYCSHKLPIKLSINLSGFALKYSTPAVQVMTAVPIKLMSNRSKKTIATSTNIKRY